METVEHLGITYELIESDDCDDCLNDHLCANGRCPINNFSIVVGKQVEINELEKELKVEESNGIKVERGAGFPVKITKYKLYKNSEVEEIDADQAESYVKSLFKNQVHCVTIEHDGMLKVYSKSTKVKVRTIG